ncbi:MAG: M48 family metalloprotease [Cyanobacteriota bacterium]|nr:M48 family metalloprotease [Cyanobacteriota bacterium]
MTSIPNPSVEAGEAALQAGDFEEAIAQLEGVCAIELDGTLVSRARQALIVAYCRCGRPADAIALCHSLVQALTPETAWANQTLADLIQRYPEANTLGLVPVRPKRGSKGKNRKIQQKTTPSSPSSSQSLIAATPPQEATPAIFVPGRQWRNAERATKWKRLKQPKLWKLGLIQLIGAIALFYVVRFSLQWSMEAVNALLVALPLLNPLHLFYRDPALVLLILFALLLLTSPWFLDLLLRQFYGLQSFSIPKLAADYPEAAKVVQKMTQQKKLPRPQLGILPTNAPVAMTYGTLPRTARIVISQGLLEQLEDSELAVLYAAQISQIIRRDFVLLSGAIAFLQLPFTLYWQTARWGRRVSEILREKQPPKAIPQSVWKILPTVVLGTSTNIASLFYGAYWLWRIPLLWISRARTYYSDRLAAEYMGNPNALSRAILKVAIGMAKNIEQQQQTSWLLEGFDLLMPVGHRQAVSLGSLPDKMPFSEVLSWECANPYRHWLILTNSHPLIGDRLYLLNRYANYWNLPAEVDLPIYVPPARTLKEKVVKLAKSYKALPILQSAVLSALFFGWLSRGLFWAIGFLNETVLSRWVSGSGLIWMYNADNDAIVRGCLLFAFSLSIIIWINGYFPDIRISPTRNEPRLQDLLSDREAVPPKSQGVRLTGTLMGREGPGNQLVQDLLLRTPTGTIKLHFFTKLGPLGNLFWGLQAPLFWLRWQPWKAFCDRYLPLSPHPQTFVDREVTVTGWFRRGSPPWIDVDTIRTKDKKMARSGYPVWVTGLAIAAALWGAWSIWRA